MKFESVLFLWSSFFNLIFVWVFRHTKTGKKKCKSISWLTFCYEVRGPNRLLEYAVALGKIIKPGATMFQQNYDCYYYCLLFIIIISSSSIMCTMTM